MAQLHKRFSDKEVKELMDRYLKGEIKRKYLQEILGIKKTRFFTLIAKYQENPAGFSVQYNRKAKNRAISPAIEKNILKELKVEQGLIKDKDVPLRSYNYTFKKFLTIILSSLLSFRAKRGILSLRLGQAAGEILNCSGSTVHGYLA